MFHTVPPSERLDRSDAHFVDVLHSAGLWIGSDEVVTKKQRKLRKLRKCYRRKKETKKEIK